jgi:hypothetical protein
VTLILFSAVETVTNRGPGTASFHIRSRISAGSFGKRSNFVSGGSDDSESAQVGGEEPRQG